MISHRSPFLALAVLAATAAAAAACGDSATPPAAAATVPAEAATAPAAAAAEPGAAARTGALNPRLLRRFKPVRSSLHEVDQPNPEQVELGRMLYFDKRLSSSHDLSCNTCHPLDRHGADGEKTSAGHRGVRGDRNSPTTYHAAGLVAEFWDGRAPNVEKQATGPITNPIEMASTPERVLATLRSIPEYRERFARAFPGAAEPLTFEHVGIAIGAFERGLVAPSRWDRYLAGDASALTPAEVSGLRLFTNVGCMVCHTGEMLGGSSFQRVGTVEPWPNQADRGRRRHTNDPADDMVFRVPSLRGVAKTAPYFHDGSAPTLEVAVAMMSKHQLGIELEKAEIASIVTWLGSLTGDLPLAYIKEPALPPSTATTPKAAP